ALLELYYCWSCIVAAILGLTAATSVNYPTILHSPMQMGNYSKGLYVHASVAVSHDQQPLIHPLQLDV
ncbi:hypothetical protein FRX31_004466, partial [Thalictrum thalictroides]